MVVFNVIIDGVACKITEQDFEKYNVLVNKSNGYSHDCSVIEKFEKTKHFYSKKCGFTNRLLDYAPNHLTKKQTTSFILGSSQVTFS